MSMFDQSFQVLSCHFDRVILTHCQISELNLLEILRHCRPSVARTLIADLPYGYFKLVFESLIKIPIAADIIVFLWIILGDVLFFCIDSGMLCVLIRIASLR